MKKLIAAALAAVLIFSCSIIVFAEDAAQKHTLQFHEDGSFTIVHLCDLQDVYPMNETTHQFVREMLAEVKPDLVILGGDNCVASQETKEDAIREICDLFVESETYFTLVFGNHDHQQGVSNADQLKMYQEFGGAYCLAYDAVPELTGDGTQNLPIMSADGTEQIDFIPDDDWEPGDIVGAYLNLYFGEE